MQLSSSTSQIPDGLLAAMTLLSEKPHQGVPSRNLAPHQGIDERNSTAALGLRASEHLNRVWPRYTNKERDTESGNDYFLARYYNSNTGRFLSPDWSAKEEPVPYAQLTDPQSLNLYSYVENNPMRKVDLDGHDFWDKLNNLAHGKGYKDTATVTQRQWADPVPPSASVQTDMHGHTTTFTGTDLNGKTTTMKIETRNNVVKGARPGADGPFFSPNIGQVGSPHGSTVSMGPAQAYINVNDPEKDADGKPRARQIHGGGTGSNDPQHSDYQGWVPTNGCTRGQNIDVIDLGKTITSYRSANPGIPISYERH
jgi:RHS repeat-associated protein